MIGYSVIEGCLLLVLSHLPKALFLLAALAALALFALARLPGALPGLEEEGVGASPMLWVCFLAMMMSEEQREGTNNSRNRASCVIQIPHGGSRRHDLHKRPSLSITRVYYYEYD